MSNHLWQSTVFAIFAGLATLGFRRNRAQVRYWLWFSASAKFLIPLALLMNLGSRFEWKPAAVSTPGVSVAIKQITEPFPENVSLVAAAPRRNWMPRAIFTVWVLGFAAIGAIRWKGWRRIRGAVRASFPLEIASPVTIRSAPGLLEPGVVGWLRPILLFPEGIADYLTPHQLESVIAHELCHIRRRDNLTSAIHMIVEAIFWFHPLVWWIGGRLVEEREKACDEAVVSLGNEPQVYAEAILNVCKLYAESPLTCVAGVTGSDLKRRIEAIMSDQMVLRLNFLKKTALVAAGLSVVTLPMLIGMTKLRAQPVRVPVFEVASIKPCGDGTSLKGGGGARGGGGNGPQGPSPDRLDLVCQPVKNLIRMAYLTFEGGHRMPPGRFAPIEGGPGWIDSERYKVDAKAEGAPGQEMMRGPMLQALLEDRFKMKVRRESREVPAYLLVAGKNGPKLQPAKEGSCIVFGDISPGKPPLPEKDRRPICSGRMLGRLTPTLDWQVRGATLDELARALSGDLDRIVVDKTGIVGKYDFQLEFSADETTVGLNSLRTPDGPLIPPGTPSDPPGGPSIFTAIQQQLGLKLESGKGQKQFLVIDRVERPTAN